MRRRSPSTAVLPLVSPPKLAPGAPFRRQVASGGAAGQGCNCNYKGAGQEAPEYTAPGERRVGILSPAYTASHGYLFLSDIINELGEMRIVGDLQADRDHRPSVVNCSSCGRAPREIGSANLHEVVHA